MGNIATTTTKKQKTKKEEKKRFFEFDNWSNSTVEHVEEKSNLNVRPGS